MSHFDYTYSKRLSVGDPPFYALIMAAIRKADSVNLLQLEMAFPEVVDEFRKRYNSPGGFLPGEDDAEGEEGLHFGNVVFKEENPE